ncbi:hypothetical protein [Vibrio sp. L85]|uniref:hypothetical protein n=1 Tax=Vibrio sp. L85 TaxID=1769292 RepID=UPI0009A2F6B1|nr:hypothetical protein [Vibrio sp. L85]
MHLSKARLLSALLITPLALIGCGGSSDGQNNGLGQVYQFSGTVQKGPLQPGSVVTIHELDQNLQPTGTFYTTEIEDYEGNYSIKERFSSPFAEIIAQGHYFNELTNSTVEQMSMSAIVNMNVNTPISFNVATAAVKQSIMVQLQGGSEFDEAVNKATSDLLRLYSYDPAQWGADINFYNVNLSNSQDISTLLLVISASTLKMATENSLTLEQQIEKISEILLDPKSEQFEEMKLSLSSYNLSLYKTEAYLNTEQYFSKHGLNFDIPHIDYFIDIDGDGVLPSKKLPVFRYTAGITANVSEASIKSLYPAGAFAIDYQGRPMTFEVTGEFKHGDIESIEYGDDGVSIMYRLKDVNFEGEINDCVTVNTVTPSKANFSYDACVNLIKEK